MRKWAAALVVPAIWVAATQAAEPVVPEEGSTIKLILLRQKSVQKELEITPEEARKIAEFTTAESEAAHKAHDLGDAERKEAYEKLRKANQEFLEKNLSAKQNKRLQQIMMQFTALHQLLKPEVAKELNLTDEQVTKLKDLQGPARKGLVELLESKEGRTEKLAKLREDTRTKILAILTDEQKEKVREMAGPPFEGEIVFEEPD
jgi:Spy/CpxP family protein refolding chaperone